MDYEKQHAAAAKEQYGHRMTCPKCDRTVDTIPAECVPDQNLRGCPECGAVFYEGDDA